MCLGALGVKMIVNLASLLFPVNPPGRSARLPFCVWHALCDGRLSAQAAYLIPARHRVEFSEAQRVACVAEATRPPLEGCQPFGFELHTKFRS